MKIVYFNYMWDLWGACLGSTIKAIELMKALSNNGHDVKMYWLRDDFFQNSGPKSDMKKSEVKEFFKKYLSKYLHEPNQIMKNIRSIKKEMIILENEKPDLVISRRHSYVFSPTVISKKIGIPYLIEIDSPGYEQMTFRKYHHTTQWLYNLIDKRHIQAGRAAFAVSNEIKKYYVDMGIPEDFMYVIPNAANPEKFRPDISVDDIREKYNLNDSVVVGFIGSFIFWHGVENLIAVMKNILSKNNNIKFLLVGRGGPLESLVWDFINENNQKEKVIMAGYVQHTDVPRYVAAMDIALAPYPNLEFFYYSPVKIFEYMSSGKPIVSSAIGQIAEIIENKKTGFLTDPGDIVQMTEAILTLAGDSFLRQKIGAAARLEILQKHTWEVRGKQLSELCQKVV